MTRLAEDGYRLPEAENAANALRRCREGETHAALLGVNRDQVRYRIEKFQLEKALLKAKNSPLRRRGSRAWIE